MGLPAPIRSLEQWADTINEHLGTAVEAIIATGRDLIAAKAAHPRGQFERLFHDHPDAIARPARITSSTARRFMIIAEHTVLSNRAHAHVLPASWTTLYELTKLPAPVLTSALRDGRIHPAMERAQVRALLATETEDVPSRDGGSGSTFNRQTGTAIEWAQWTWNPVTGCKHNCSYCYARDIAERFYPQGFAPTFHPERLSAPRRTRVPAEAVHDLGLRNVFTCSMADLFGRWVPREWIEDVLGAARGSPEWNYLFLTKFPQRLREFEFGEHMWVGTSVDAQARVAIAEAAFEHVRAGVRWLSCEPLLEPLHFAHLDRFDWIVIGGASASTQTPAWHPPLAWVADLEYQAKQAGCRVYHKANLFARRREYPGGPVDVPVRVAEAFHMGYLQRDITEPRAYAAEVMPT